MAAIERFEDIEAWQKARILVNEIYVVTGQERFAKDYGLKEQIRRAAVSILSNIAEGFERGGNKEFIQFLYVAKGSCGEVRAQLYVARDQKYITEVQFRNLIQQTLHISKMLAGFINYLKRSIYKGAKHKP
jgi:four helix bundle protein